MADSKGGVISTRSTSFTTLPPGTLGFSKLQEPDEYEGKKSFKANIHFNEAALERLETVLTREMDSLWTQFLKDAEKAGKKADKLAKPDVGSWIEDHLKPFKEGTRIELPFVTFKNDAEYRDKKSGEMRMKTMKLWDGKGTLLDPEAIKLGMGSTVAPVIAAGIFVSGIIKVPTPTLKLQGLKVLKLVQWGVAPDTGDLSEEDMAVLGDDFDLEDLSGFGKKADAPKPPKAGKGSTHPDFTDDLDDEIPF